MDEQELSIQAHFADVTDPRKAWNQDHRLSDILVMALITREISERGGRPSTSG